jgi:hypothetical protein
MVEPITILSSRLKGREVKGMMNLQGKWIDFIPLPDDPSKCTHIWSVVSHGGVKLGEIKWMGAWRKYAFWTEGAIILEPTCLNDLTRFLGDAMQERMEERARENKSA